MLYFLYDVYTVHWNKKYRSHVLHHINTLYIGNNKAKKFNFLFNKSKKVLKINHPIVFFLHRLTKVGLDEK